MAAMSSNIPIFRPLFRRIFINKNNYKLPQKGLSVFKFASSEAQQEPAQNASEIVKREKIQLRKSAINKIQRPPFAKNLFLGILNTDLLSFPEILDNEHVPELEEHVKQINDIFQNTGILMKTDEEKKLPENLLRDLKDLGIFGRLVPKEYGGLGLTMTEYTRLNEVIGLDWSLAASLVAHELLATQVIVQAGTDDQKTKYLPDLASGNRIAAFCFYEMESGSDLTKPKTFGKWIPESNCFSLSGTKSWVTNGQNADLFLVFSKSAELDEKDEKFVVFIVDRNSDGIKVMPLDDKIGLKSSGVAVVQFEDVTVPKENVIGSIGSGMQILNTALESCRFGLSSVTIGTLKSLLDYVTDYAINSDRHERALSDLELVQETLTNIARRIYAMESVSYYTAAIIDSTENPDCSMECFISKAFNSEGTLYCLRELMKICGCLSLSESHLINKLHEDALGLANFDGPNDVLRFYIGLLGCQYAGSKRAELVKQSRNSYLFPMQRIRSMMRAYRINTGKIKFTQDIAGHLHPSLVYRANKLEECVQRLDYATYSILTEEGQFVTETQLDPTRLGDMVTDIYVCTAVLVRSSRSYCIGLRNADNEIQIAFGICDEAYRRITNSYNEIVLGPHCITDAYALQTGIQVVKHKGYFPEHPLKHNF